MSAKSFFRKLMTRSVRPQPTGTIRKPVSPLRRQVEGLEDRVNPATLNYDAVTDILTFTADAGDTDNVTVTAPAANSVVIAVANGDTLTLTGDATLANGFVLSGGNTVTIDTGLSPAANFNINLGDANDTIAFSLASTPNGVQNVSIDGQANDDTATIGTTTVTGNLAVAVESISSNGTATVGAGAGNSITLTADTITDANAAGVNFVAAAGTLTITKSNANATNVDLDTTVGSLNATAATGSIVIDETNGLTVTAANANGAGGAVTVTSATGNITVVTVNANTTATLTATAGSILDDANGGTRITAAAANLTAGNGSIGILGDDIETDVGTLTTNSAAANGVQIITEASGLTELSVNAGTGNVTLVAGGAIQSADSAVDVTAGLLQIAATGSIGTTSTAAGNAVETSVANLQASANGGSVFIRETDAVTLSTVIATGAGNDVSVLNVTGDMTVVSVNAADDVSLTATAGSILDDNNNGTVVVGDAVSLSAGVNIGQPGAIAQIDTLAASITASATNAPIVGVPGIWIGDADAVTITSATTADGTIVLDAGGTMTVGTVAAGGTGRNVRLLTTVGDIAFGAAGSVTAAGDGVRLQAAGAITESGAAVKVTAASLSASAGSGIGAGGDPLNTQVTNLAATSTTNGVHVLNTGALTVGTVGPLFGVTVIGVAASGAGGVVVVAANSPLVVAANVTSSGPVILAAADSAAAGDDLTINSGVVVTSATANVQLVAGDNVSIPAGATVNAAASITILVDLATDPDAGVGTTVAIAGDLNATSATISSGADNDTFNITADGLGTITPITVNGAAPTTLPGDTLNYTGPSPATKSITGPGAGTITAAGVGNVSYTSIETVAPTGSILFSDVINLALIAGGQDGNPNQVVLQLDATSAFFQVLIDTDTTDNGGVPNPVLYVQQAAPSTQSITVLGGTDADTLVLRGNAGGALPVPSNVAAGSHTNAAFTSSGATYVNAAGNKNVGLHFDGGANADAMRVELTSARNVGYFSDEVDTANSGVVSVGGLLNASFENLTPLVVVGAGGSYLIDASANASVTSLTVTNSGAAADGVSNVSGNGTFESTDFSGFSNVTVRSGPGADTITLTSVDGAAPAGPAGAQALAVLNLDGDDITNTDVSADVINVVSLPATVDAFVFGGAGLDTFNVGTANTLLNPGLLSPVQGDVAVDGEADGADLRVDGSGANALANYEITNNRVERSVPAVPLFGGVDYTNLTTLLLTVGNGPNVINVVSTVVPTTIQTNRGADVINIGGDGVNGGAIPALAGPRSLDGIQGAVTIDGGTGAGLVAPITPDFDTVNINDQDDTGASTYGISPTTITRTGAANITYNVGLNTEVLNVNGSITAASNTFNVTGTSASQSTTVNDGTAATSGTGTFNIQADAVQSGAAHTFNGFGGVDVFNVNFAADASVPAAMGTTFVVNGGDPGVADPLLRDVVNLDTTLDAVIARIFTVAFLGGGNVTVAGLGAATAIELNTVESVVYRSDAADDDQATVLGTAAADVISVTPLAPDAAAVFLGGTPTITIPPGTPAANDPGVAGGNAGPDLFLFDLVPGDTFLGLTIDGNGGGDQLVVNAPTEAVNGADQGAAWNPALFGGPAGASVVLAAGAAFDVIDAGFNGAGNIGFIDIVNASLGGNLLGVNYVVASFAGANAADVVINSGEEVIGAATVADDISVELSTQIGYQINGGAPLPPAGAPLTGDRLNVIAPTELTVYSDANTPPNISVTSSVNGTPTQPLTTNNIELLILTSGNGQVNILGDNNNTATQADALIILGQDVDSTLAGGDLFGDNEFQLLIHGDNTVSLLNQAPIAVRNVLNLNVQGFNGDDDIVIDPFANSTTPWGVAVNVDAGLGDDDLVYGNVIRNIFADDTPDGSQALLNEAVVAEATITPGAGSITTPGAVTISFQSTEDLSFFLNDTTLGDTDTLLIRTPNSAGVPETVTVNPDAAGTDADPNVDIDASVGVQLLQIENFSLIDPTGAPFFALAFNFELGNGTDTFIVTPSANGTAVNVNGGAPSTGPGDTLDVRFAGTTSPLLSVTAGPPSYTGSWTFANRAAVNFADFESIFPTVTVAATSQAAEPATNGAFTFTRTGDTALALTVNYTISGTATAGADYTPLTGTATFAPGSATAVVGVAVIDDLTFEFGPAETVIVTLAAGSQYVIGAAPANTATVAITEDDTQPTIALAADVTVTEGGTAVFTVNLSNPSTQTITVQVATTPGTATPAVDYTTNTQTLTFAPGQTSLTFSVATNDDLLDEANETFTVTLSSPTNATIDTDFGSADATITDNDAAPSFTINDVLVDEGAGTATFTITLSAVSGQSVTVDYATTAGTAVAPEDYTAIAATTLTFAPGVTSQTVTVSIINDTIDEPAQVFTVDLTGAVNATIADASGSGTITDNDNAPTISVADATVTEGALLNFTVTLSAASQHVITVFAETANDTATSPDDYGFGNVLLTFNPGQTSIGVLVQTIDDALDEIGTERLFLNLSGPSNVTIADGTGDGFILDNDAPPVLSVADVTVTEGGTATFTITLDAASALPVTVQVDTAGGTAVPSVDYTTNAQLLTFAPGQTSLTFSVATNNDLLDEDDETFTVTLTGPTNATLGTAVATGTITDDDATPTVSVNDVTVNEAAGTMTFTLTLSAVSGRTITVDYTTVDGSAVAGEDYTALTGTVTFAPGETTQTVIVSVLDDAIDEPTQTFLLSLINGVNVGPGNQLDGVGTIEDNDDAPTVSIDDVTVDEAAGTATFTATLSAASQHVVTVQASTADGTAVAPADYATQTATLTFAAGVLTQTFTVAIADDTLDENDETYTVTLSDGVNVTIADGTGAGTITDNDDPPVVSINDVGATVDEGQTGTFTVSLSTPSALTVTVVVATSSGGNAAPGLDYTPSTLTLTFAPGETVKTFSVFTLDDLLDEDTETYTVTLSGPTNATLGTSTAPGEIQDNDATPTVSVNDVTVNEAAGTMTFTVTLSAVSGRTVTVDYQTADSDAVAGADYTAANGTLTFAPGVTTQTVTVTIAEDLLDEAAEAFTLNLTGPTNAVLNDAQGVGTILDNDNPPTVSVDDVTVDEAAGTATFTVTLSAESGQTITLTASTAAGSATAGLDYTTLSQLLTFAPGVLTQTFVVDITDDTADELPETFFVNLTGPTNVTLNDAQGVGTITDNDDAPLVSITGTPTVVEGVTAEFTVSLSAESWQTITVRVATVQGTAGSGVDYVPVIQTLTFAPGVTSQTVSVPTVNEALDEVDETFTAVLSSPTNTTIDVGTDTATIIDDDAPVAANDAYTTAEDTLLTVAAPGVLGNDTANPTRVTELVTTTANGVLTLYDDGSFTYVPNLNFSGTDTFTYSVYSGGALNEFSNVATVTITVTPRADAPTLTATTPVTGNEGAAIPLPVTAALVDTDGSETLAVTVTGFPAGTTFSAGINNNNTLSLTPAQLTGLTMTVPDGTRTFNLQVTATATEGANGAAASTSSVVVVTINNVNPTGTLTNNGPVNEGSTATVTYTAQADPSQPDVVAGHRYSFDLDNDGDFDIGDGTYAGSVEAATATVPATLLDDGPGTRVVRGRIIDKDGGFTESLTTIDILNVAPTATFTGPASNERVPLTVTFSNPTDPSDADTLAGFTYSYDLDNDGVFEVGPTASPTATFTPADDGVYTVRGRVIDKDGGFTEYTANGAAGLVVRNVDRYAIGTGNGGAPRVIVYETGTDFVTGGTKMTDFFAYDAEFRGGVQVAVGDVTGDGVPDIVTGTGVGGGPHVKVFDGVTFELIGNFLAYEETFRGGVQVAVGDLDGDGRAEVITGVGDTGGPVVKVFRHTGALVSSFMAYEGSFRGGVNVGAADVDGDGKAEILTGAGNGGGPVVKIFDGTSLALRRSFLAYEESFRGGVNVAGGDLDGDGRAEIVTGAGIGGGPVVKAFSPAGAVVLSTSVFGPDKIGGEPLRNGTRVAVHDIDGDGDHDVVVGSGPDYSASVSLRRGSDLAELSNFRPYEADNDDRIFTGGVYVG